MDTAVFDISRVLLLLFTIVAIVWIHMRVSRDDMARLYAIMPVLGIVMFSSISSTYEHIPYSLFISNIAFIFTFSLVFTSLILVFGKSNNRQGVDENIRQFLTKYSSSILFLYVALLVLDLVTPEMRLHLILSPPSPDLHALMFERFNETRELSTFESLVNYLQLLLTPLFFASLQYKKAKISIILSLVTIYLLYVHKAYISRGDVLLYLFTILIYYWVAVPKYRYKITAISLLLFPLLIYLSYMWMYLRLGIMSVDESFITALYKVFESQTNFADLSAVPLIESQDRINLKDYFVWLVTLPIPKAIFGSIEVVRINYEISETVLGVSRGASGFYINLPGVVAEGVYIYDKLYLIHAASMSAVFYVLYRFIGSYRSLVLLNAYYLYMISYAFPRAGVSAIMPILLNLSILVYAIIVYYRMTKK